MMVTSAIPFSEQNINWVITANFDPWLHLALCQEVIDVDTFRMQTKFRDKEHQEIIYLILRGVYVPDLETIIGSAAKRFLDKLLNSQMCIVRLYKSNSKRFIDLENICEDVYNSRQADPNNRITVYMGDIHLQDGTDLADLLRWRGYAAYENDDPKYENKDEILDEKKDN